VPGRRRRGAVFTRRCLRVRCRPVTIIPTRSSGAPASTRSERVIRNDGSYTDEDQELILDHGIVPAPLGSYGDYGRGLDPYNNAIVYWFAFLSLFVVLLAPVAIGIAVYRIARHRTHAVRGLVVALVCGVVGTMILVVVVGART